MGTIRKILEVEKYAIKYHLALVDILNSHFMTAGDKVDALVAIEDAIEADENLE